MKPEPEMYEAAIAAYLATPHIGLHDVRAAVDAALALVPVVAVPAPAAQPNGDNDRKRIARLEKALRVLCMGMCGSGEAGRALDILNDR